MIVEELKMVNTLKLSWKTIRNGYKSTIMEYRDKTTMNTRCNLHIFIKYFLPASQSTKHLVDQLSADYIGFYSQGSGKSDKYGSFLLPV